MVRRPSARGRSLSSAGKTKLLQGSGKDRGFYHTCRPNKVNTARDGACFLGDSSSKSRAERTDGFMVKLHHIHFKLKKKTPCDCAFLSVFEMELFVSTELRKSAGTVTSE